MEGARFGGAALASSGAICATLGGHPQNSFREGREMSKASVYIETFGCQMNVADAERAASRLRAAGYELVGQSAADVVLLNTCSVRARAEQKVFNRVGEIRKERGRTLPLIGVMGCVAQLEGDALFERAEGVRMVVGTRATDRLPLLIERALVGARRVVDLGERGEDEGWDISPVERHSPYVALVPIIEGCNKFCAYCIVPYSRGRERSRPASEIIAEAHWLRRAGYHEIQLIGQNVNSYRPRSETGLEGFGGATPFSRLLRAVAATGISRVKFTTSFPRDFHADIVAALDEHENLCNWVHLPAQSGSDRVLRAMRRGYRVADYMARVEAIRRARRPLALTGDIIVGFPGETVEDFRETMRLVEECQYHGLYIFKYSERRGTPAARLPETISEAEKRSRFLELESLQSRIERKIYRSYVGRRLSVLVEGISARDPLDVTGHSTCQKVVNGRGDKGLQGRVVEMRVVEAKAHSLYAEVVP